MAFTASEKISIIKIVGVDSITLDDRLDYFDTQITTDVEDAVREEIVRWVDDKLGSDFIQVEPNIANFGARINPDLARNDIKRNIARLLFLEDYLVAAGTGRRVRA